MQGAAALETIRDINVASRLIGDMSSPTLDDPLFDRYKKLGCSISPVEKDSDDYKMVANYLEKTYEPTNVGETVRCDRPCFFTLLIACIVFIKFTVSCFPELWGIY